jgi:UDP-glucose 4-epimerase
VLTHRNAGPVAPARVVLLGANGFLASHLAGALAAQGRNPIVVGSAEVDLTDRESAPKLARLLQAGDTIVMTSMLTPGRGRDFKTCVLNILMAETVCRALQDTGCAHFVYLSSDAVYDGSKLPIDESSGRQPMDLYASAHTSRELMLGSVLAGLKAPLCILRPTNIYGPGNRHNNYGPNRFTATAVLENRISLFGRGEECRSHIYVDDVVRLVIGAIERRSEGALNLAAAQAISFLEVAETVARHCKHPVRLEYLDRVVPAVDRPYDVSALRTAFPDFSYTPFEVGIRAQIASLSGASSP